MTNMKTNKQTRIGPLGFAGFILLATKRGKQTAKNNNHDLFHFFHFLFMLDSFAYCESIDEFLGLHSLIEFASATHICALDIGSVHVFCARANLYL